MPRPIVSLRERLAIHERKTNELYAARQEELMNVFKACNALAIDDALLAGFLVFAMDQANKDGQILKDFVKHAKESNVIKKSKFFKKQSIK